MQFIFAGTGPLEETVNGIKNIKNVGFQKGEALEKLIREARFSIYPSEWYENCPFSVMESQMYGTPVLGAEIGGIPELIRVGKTGELFESGNGKDLKRKIEKLWGDKKLCAEYSANCKDISFDEFAILRIGYRGYGEEGTLNADEKFEQNMENARKAGIDVGVYFFSQAVNDEEAKEEADFVLEHLKGQELQMPVVYDPEHILEDEARTDGVTGEQFTQNAKVFCKEIEKAGYDAMIYSNMLWEAYELDLEKLLDYPVWYADYEELPQTPYRFSMWQYSSTGIVPGIEGNVDLNIQLLKK